MTGTDLAIALRAATVLDGYDVVFSDNERLGAAVGAVLRSRPRRPKHVVLAHHLSPGKKRPFIKLARPGIDQLIVHCEPQKRLATKGFGFGEPRVTVLPYQVDTAFWQPQDVTAETNIIGSAGLEFRDYETLLTALSGLDIEVRIGAASNWSRKKNTLAGRVLPPAVSVGSYSYRELRDLYARSRIVVVPLLETDFQAGVTLILEAMSSGKPVIVSRTTGQREVVVGPLWQAGQATWPEGEESLAASTGIYVPPGDAAALRSAMQYLLANPGVRRVLGDNGRRAALGNFTIEQFAQRFAAVLDPARFARRESGPALVKA